MNYKIPLFKLNFDVSEKEAAVKTIESQWLSMGPQSIEFEEEFALMTHAKYGVTLANCTAALHLALIALDIKKGDEVIVPSLTFVATVNAVKYVDAIPVFVDITSEIDLTLSVEDIKRKITSRTKAIIPMHFAGYGADMDAILEIAEEYNLKIIEDSCHAPLSEYKGRKLGSIGDIGCFSFFSNKNISTGEGGMITTNSQDISEKIKLLRSHGMTTMSYQRAAGHATSYDVISHGYNFRMDDLRASIGLAQLKKLEHDLTLRAQVRQWYLSYLTDLELLFVPFANRVDFSSNYVMPIVLKQTSFEKRDELRRYLHENGIQTSVHYPAVHRFSAFKEYYKGDLPITNYVTDAEITLPMYSSLKEDEVKYIVDMLKSGIKHL